MNNDTHIAVLMGGWSPEREISLLSGAGVVAALRECGYRVSTIDVAHNLPEQLAQTKPDICFNALHGVGGEDGAVQGVLEVLQIPYTHSGVRASALAMDKHLSKQIFAAAGLPVAASVLLNGKAVQDHPMPPPYVVKPTNQGSSVGVEIVQIGEDLPPSLQAGGWSYDSPAMIEAYIAGRELTCAVLDNAPTGVMEILPIASNTFYDYRAKYDEGGSQHHIPADISASLLAQVQDVSVQAHKLLGCRGASRADFRYDSDKDGLILLEINTQPGMTELSLVPEMAAAQGMTYTDLVKWMVEDASCQR